MVGPKIFVATSNSTLRGKIREALTRGGYLVVGEAGDSNGTLRGIRQVAPDLVILDLDLAGMGGLEVAKIIEEDRVAPILLLVSNWQREVVEKARERWVFSFLAKPVSEASLYSAVESAIFNYQKMLRLEEEVNRLKESLETRKLVERAKGILMETLGLSEREAFRRIQQQSMDRSLAMRAVAEAIILADETQRKSDKPSRR